MSSSDEIEFLKRRIEAISKIGNERTMFQIYVTSTGQCEAFLKWKEENGDKYK